MILDDMKELGITRSEMSMRTGIPESVIRDIIKGRKDIDTKNAVLIAEVLGYAPRILINAQNNYYIDKMRISERKRSLQRH